MSETLTQAQKDALIADVLGDVGQLRDEVAAMLAEVKLMPADIARLRDGSLAEIKQAAEAAVKVSEKELTERFIRSVTEKATHTATTAIERALDPARNRVIEATATLRQSAAQLGTESTWLKGRTAFAWRISLAVGAASSAVTAMLFIGAMVVSGPHWMTPDQTRQMKVGQSLDRVWSELDEATRNRVQRAIDATTPEK